MMSGGPATQVRTATAADLDALYTLAVSGGSGLTNLPPDRDALRAKLEASERAIASAEARESGAAIMLMVEHGGRVVGTSCVFPRVGAEWPFHSYRLTRQANRSLAVGRLKAQTLLNLANDFDGECEVGGLFIDPAMRGAALGMLAARARYLFIATHRDWFGRRVMAELRGWQDAEGKSPVWEAIGRQFYDMDFQEADRTGALSGNQFIADLGPRYPLYVSLLPKAAQEALGRPHDDGRPAFEMLLTEGFVAGDYVDIFDGGPTVVADIDSVRTIRDAKALTVTDIVAGGTPSLVATGKGVAFRVGRGAATPDGQIDTGLADTLGLSVGDPILAVAA
jgi:arginine N-succinyltransferase